MSLRIPPCAALPLERMRSNYYQLLGISPSEPDARVIEEAALACSAQFRVYQLSHETECTLLLNRLALALNTLLDPINRRAYDLDLGRNPDPASEIALAGERRDEPVPARQGIPTSREQGSSPLVISPLATCDVKLVYCESAS
jgi:hypothetical protein